jgi:hypothetical protein
MTTLTYNETTNRVQYGNKQYRSSSKTGFELLCRYLVESEQVLVFHTEKYTLGLFGNKVFYQNLRGTTRTYTPKGKVGQYFFNLIKATLAD